MSVSHLPGTEVLRAETKQDVKSAEVPCGLLLHSGPHRIAILEGEEAFYNLRSEWENLWWQSADATQAQTWQWQYLYWSRLASTARPVIVIARDFRNVCVALAAFFLCRDRSSWVRKAAFLGDKRPDYHVILVQPGVAENVGCQILEAFVDKFQNQVPFIELSNIPEGSYTRSSVERFLREREQPNSLTERWVRESYAVPLPDTLDEYLKQLGSRSRRDFRYDRKKLCSEFSVDFRVYSQPDHLDEALDAVEAVDRARWGANSRYYLASERAFERAIGRALCKMGLYRAFVIYLNGKPAAFVTGAVVRNAFKVASIGFDRSLPSRLSVGKVANFYAIEHCIQHGCREYDLTRGGEAYKKWLGAVPTGNLHARVYRSKMDRWLESSGQKVLSLLRSRSWLYKLYQATLRR
jgi:CelD/BcsL family acetyltransferase involved in cellulose biosynthesis